MGRKSDLERGSEGQEFWQERGREACEEGGGKILTCKTQQILYLDENKPRKEPNLEYEPRVDGAGLTLCQRKAQSA